AAAGAVAGLAPPPHPPVGGGGAGGRPARGVEVLAAIRASGGSAVQIDDGTARRTRAELSRLEGLDLEYTSAVGFAAASQLRTSGVIGSNDRVLIAATGIGLKDAGV
ncbi:MAG: hypothetical protein OXI70_07850, partial [Chloroflexota bacterium]|nr:hypothetical protein [Chloroflexota bacterium]